MKLFNRFVCAGVLGTFLASMPCPAQSPQSKIIVADVILEGNQRVPTEKILSMIKTRPGAEYDQERVNEDVRRVYLTHEFAGIQVQRRPAGDGKVIVYFHFAELPNTVQEVVYNGAKHVKLDELEKITGLHKGMPLSPVTNHFACTAILKHYHDKGRLFASVDLVEGDKAQDTRVVFNITEGPVIKVSGIEIQGCTFFLPARLEAQLNQLGAFQGWLSGDYNPISSSPIWCADQMIAKLEDYYRCFGFLDVRVAREMQWDEGQRFVKLIFHVEEGPRSRVGTATSPVHTEIQRWTDGEIEIQYQIRETHPGPLGTIRIPNTDPSWAGSWRIKP